MHVVRRYREETGTNVIEAARVDARRLEHTLVVGLVLAQRKVQHAQLTVIVVELGLQLTFALAEHKVRREACRRRLRHLPRPHALLFNRLQLLKPSNFNISRIIARHRARTAATVTTFVSLRSPLRNNHSTLSCRLRTQEVQFILQ